MNKLIGLTLVALVVIFLFIYVATNKSVAFLPSSPSSPASSKITPVPLQTRIINLIVKDDKIAGGPTRIALPKGIMVVLQIHSDSDDIFSLSGYDKAVNLEKGKTVVLSFLTTLSGNFTYSLNNSSYLGNLLVTAK